ncbi:uncharacterized protein TA12415 [Theileria annulata]|uniref:Uncharacterized protein n=1 Tax=Theileria annulata TaxID=5874 RepID=Q4UE03_THEAN|nr:uncharacterized protein TA12415 [Theileria annulata]CAI74686.1 hypothetical protein, conserved [Theileria annulata]|eukprot:XP_952418.1 hypothetical protein, conserved [Theileria annulata]
MFNGQNYGRLCGIISKFTTNRIKCRFFNIQSDKSQLIKKVSSNRKQWEQLRKESRDDTSDFDNISFEKTIAHSGFGKSQNSKSKHGFKYLGLLQTVTNSTSDEKLFSLLADISKFIDEFTPYELIDIGYFLTRINRPGCSQVVEPILHRFFSMPERFSCLNGVYFHRLLRTMFIFQDVTYRVWVYEIAQLVSAKHAHLLMRDVQLVIDDLSLFYDAAAQGALNQLEDSVLSRVHELELYRLPLLIHALGRCGYNSINVAKAVHRVYTSYKGHKDYYSSHLIGLLLKGYASFHFNPGTEFLDDVWSNVKDNLKNVEFKYLSWIGESFLKLRYFPNISVILDELISKHSILSHLEFTDFISDCWSIQTHILSLEFKNYIVPGSVWQNSSYSDEGFSEMNPNSLSQENNSKETVDKLYGYYKRLITLINSEMPGKIYESTPPYRSTQFELMTRLLDIYPNPRDFRIILPLRKYDAIYPVLSLPKSLDTTAKGDISYLFTQMDHFHSSNFFGPNSNHEQTQLEYNTIKSVDPPISNVSGSSSGLKELNPILKQYIHSVFFRTPALAPRGLRLLIQGLARIHFEQREESEIDRDLIPNMKVKYHKRPLSRSIVREVYRKLACFNNDDLIVSLFGMIVLNMFEFQLSKQLLSELIRIWVHQKNQNFLLDEQLEMVSLFFLTLEKNNPSVYSSLDVESIKKLC